MSLPREDVRSKVTPKTLAVLRAFAQQHPSACQSTLIGEILDGWADKRVHEATVLLEALKREGLAG